jgi:hypothetical protein
VHVRLASSGRTYRAVARYVRAVATYYELLGVEPTADEAALRAAYRRLARRHHPDAPGGDSAHMAVVNDAWRVLSDPVARRAYDASLRPAPVAPAPTEAPHDPVEHPGEAPETSEPLRARWPIPLPWIAVLVALAVIFVFTAYAVGPGDRDSDVDGVLRSGSCVRLDLQSLAFEVDCDGPHYGVVERLVPFDARCPTGTEGHPDRGGQGLVCVTPGG